MLTLKEFKEARGVLSGVIRNTSLVYSPAFSKATSNQIYIKPENMQVTGAYKIRGAYYKISTLSDEEKARGLVTASAGNHAQGVALAARRLGCRAVIVMPVTAPALKVEAVRNLGGEVVLVGESFTDAAQHAEKMQKEEGLSFVHPFDDPYVIAGQGTISSAFSGSSVGAMRIEHFSRVPARRTLPAFSRAGSPSAPVTASCGFQPRMTSEAKGSGFLACTLPAHGNSPVIFSPRMLAQCRSCASRSSGISTLSSGAEISAVCAFSMRSRRARAIVKDSGTMPEAVPECTPYCSTRTLSVKDKAPRKLTVVQRRS